MGQLDGKVAWVTGAGSGIGAATALALAREGAAAVVLTGRRVAPLEEVARQIGRAGAEVHLQPGDLTHPASVDAIAEFINQSLGRLDILVNNAGVNVNERRWRHLSAESVNTIVQGDLASQFYCSIAALRLMRPRQDGVLIHIASFAGRWVSILGGPAYSAAKHGMVAMSHSINMEECINGIRSCVICPNEVATAILKKRPVPLSDEELAQMLKPEDVADVVRYVAGLPKHVCMNEVLISPTWNRTYVAVLKSGLI